MNDNRLELLLVLLAMGGIFLTLAWRSVQVGQTFRWYSRAVTPRLFWCGVAGHFAAGLVSLICAIALGGALLLRLPQTH